MPPRFNAQGEELAPDITPLEHLARDCTEDIRRKLPVTRGPEGRYIESDSPTVAWLRGHDRGVFDAYTVIRKRYPGAARAILRHFKIKENGTWQIGKV